MKKNKVYKTLLGLIFLLAFNAIFFLVAGFKHPASVWIAYAMIQASYLMLLFTPLFVSNRRIAIETGHPLFYISGMNFVVHFIVGLIFILVAPERCKLEIVVYIIMVAIYLVLFAILQLANSNTEAAVARRSQETFFIKNQASKLKMLIGRTDDKELNQLLEAVADNMHASPSKSGGAALSIETGIAMKVCDIELAVTDGRADDAKKMLRELLYLIDERKRILSIHY